MANYTLNNIRRLVCHLDEFDYWDMHVNEDRLGKSSRQDEGCLSALIDTSRPECFEGKELLSLPEYSWEYACSQGLTLKNIGYTGVDNGLFTYRKDRITADQFYRIYSGSTCTIESGDTRVHLHAVSGNTLVYDYPMSRNSDGSIKLNGGFYQGFFRSGNNYSVLPTDVEGSWRLSFDIRPMDYAPESKHTLNDKYPDNKGIFFYMGTRAEDKWSYIYNSYPMSGETFCEEDEEEDYFDLIEEEKTLTPEELHLDNGISIVSEIDNIVYSDNKFLLFNRSCDGLTTLTYKGDEEAMLIFEKRKFNGNLFLYMNHSCTGYTTCNIDELYNQYSGETSYDVYADVPYNAFALAVKDDGSVGYKYCVKDCESASEGHISIKEGYSKPSVVKTGEWNHIEVLIRSNEKKIKLYFYVNGMLKYITSEMPKFNFRKLDDIDEKQEGVAFNISLGGGTQGLAETIMPDWMLTPGMTFPIEENFAGTFIGDIRRFGFYTC